MTLVDDSGKKSLREADN